jgi:hypothetical protein
MNLQQSVYFIAKSISVAVLLFYTLLGCQSSFADKHEVFSTSRWIKNQSARHTMLKDLFDRNLMTQKDSNSLKEILGEPTIWLDPDKHHNYSWRYDAGFSTTRTGPQIHYLDISFDDFGKVEKVMHSSK